MERSPDEGVTRFSRDIARREQLKALLTGPIATLEATTCGHRGSTGDRRRDRA